MTVTDLLLTTNYMGNQSKLAEKLNITRGTLRKYMEDKEGDHHFISNGEFYANLTSKISTKGAK